MGTEGIDKTNQIYRSKKQMMFNNFLGGVAWSFGTIIGGALLIALIGFIIAKIDFVPIIGSFVRDVMEEAFRGRNTVI